MVGQLIVDFSEPDDVLVDVIWSSTLYYSWLLGWLHVYDIASYR